RAIDLEFEEVTGVSRRGIRVVAVADGAESHTYRLAGRVLVDGAGARREARGGSTVRAESRAGDGKQGAARGRVRGETDRAERIRVNGRSEVRIDHRTGRQRCRADAEDGACGRAVGLEVHERAREVAAALNVHG